MSLREIDWDDLFNSIEEHGCTPFVGAGASASWLPLGSKLSSEMAIAYGYPLDDTNVLDSVSQFVAIERGDMVPKDFISRLIKKINIPDFCQEKFKNTPHAVLADLNLPLYITTNYDKFMEAALECTRKLPDSEFCRWNKFLKNDSNSHSVFEEIDYAPSKEKPLVYHLHGHIHYSRSMVLTETDYLDFLINLSKEEILPRQVSLALNSTS